MTCKRHVMCNCDDKEKIKQLEAIAQLALELSDDDDLNELIRDYERRFGILFRRSGAF